jgi:8-oxo-dGTP pyrophosphatase MutT (NUDIX family)
MIIQPEVIKRNLAKFIGGERKICPPLPGIQPNKPEPAAVLIPLVMENEQWKLLFIKRTHHPEDCHSGQIAFPGGRADQSDRSLLNTALREAAEEIGIHPEDIEILGKSCPITTVTNYRISPFVGILPWPYSLKLSQEEVEKAFLIPLRWLNDPGHRRQKTWRSSSHPEVDIPVIYFKEFKGEVLWGATAQIVVDFLDILQLSP